MKSSATSGPLAGWPGTGPPAVRPEDPYPGRGSAEADRGEGDLVDVGCVAARVGEGDGVGPGVELDGGVHGPVLVPGVGVAEVDGLVGAAGGGDDRGTVDQVGVVVAGAGGLVVGVGDGQRVGPGAG